jgi:hypothetical protein
MEDFLDQVFTRCQVGGKVPVAIYEISRLEFLMATLFIMMTAICVTVVVHDTFVAAVG